MVKPKQLKSGRWLAREYIGNGKYRTLGTYDTAKEAEKAQILAEAGIRPQEDPEPVHDNRGAQLFVTYAEEVLWARRHVLAFGSWENYSSKLRKHIIPTFGKKRLCEITPSMVRRWWVSLPENASRKMIYVTLRMILERAVKDGILDRNPCTIESISKVKAKTRPTFSLADFQMLLASVSTNQEQSLLWVLFGGGVRIGEALALNVADVDLDAGEITVNKHVIRRGAIVQGTKHHHDGERVLALPQKAVGALRSHLQGQVRLPSDPLFEHSRGGRMQYDTAWTWFNDLRKSLALDDLHLHDVRHISLTLFAQHSTMGEVMERGGHSDYRSALRYQHSSRDRDRAIVAAMEEAL